jgi:NADH:ubiquinone reductase (H+-translocating)
MSLHERAPHTSSPPRVVVVGAGFAGLEVARHLGAAGVPVVLIDRTNHHLFQPLLYQVATAALAAPDIAEPVRKILRRYPSVRVVYGEAEEVDRAKKQVRLTDGGRIAYTHLVLAAGSTPFYFRNEEWARHAPGLKTIEDARLIRSRLLLAFEKAEQTSASDERRRLMTFVVIGGGPTGVELAGSIAELSRHALARDFRAISPGQSRIILVEGGPRLLGGFDERLSVYAKDRLARLGVEVMTGTNVREIGPRHVLLGERRLATGLALWAAGVEASRLGANLGAPLDRSGRVIVAPDLSVPGQPGIFVLGDLAHADQGDGVPLPGLAQVARQQGQHLGRHLGRYLRDGTAIPIFRYSSRGNTAIVGRHAAVYEHGRMRLRGWLAWMFWAIVHVYLLVGFQKRLTVSVQWLWRYLTYERGARLISTDHHRPAERPAERPPFSRTDDCSEESGQQIGTRPD